MSDYQNRATHGRIASRELTVTAARPYGKARIYILSPLSLDQ
jgi:hypothetical protein